MKEAVADVIAAARRAGIRAGMYLNSRAEIRDWLPQNLDFYVYPIDTKVLAPAYAAAAGEMRSALPNPLSGPG